MTKPEIRMTNKAVNSKQEGEYSKNIGIKDIRYKMEDGSYPFDRLRMELSLWLEEILRKTQDGIELCWN